MNHDEIVEVLGAFALDAVDPDEAREVEEHLLRCPRCRAEVAEHREVAALVAFGGGDAPGDVWDRIASSLDVPPPPIALTDRRRSRATAPLAAALAAAAALIAVLGFEVRDQAQRIDKVEAAVDAPDFALALDDPDAEVVSLASSDEHVVVRLVLVDGTGYLRANALPALGKGRTYQLWGSAGGELVSLGVLGRDPGEVRFNDEGYGLYAITEEQAPGVVTSSNAPVVRGSRSI